MHVLEESCSNALVSNYLIASSVYILFYYVIIRLVHWNHFISVVRSGKMSDVMSEPEAVHLEDSVQQVSPTRFNQKPARFVVGHNVSSISVMSRVFVFRPPSCQVNKSAKLVDTLFVLLFVVCFHHVRGCGAQPQVSVSVFGFILLTTPWLFLVLYHSFSVISHRSVCAPLH